MLLKGLNATYKFWIKPYKSMVDANTRNYGVTKTMLCEIHIIRFVNLYIRRMTYEIDFTSYWCYFMFWYIHYSLLINIIRIDIFLFDNDLESEEMILQSYNHNNNIGDESYARSIWSRSFREEWYRKYCSFLVLEQYMFLHLCTYSTNDFDLIHG